MNKLVVFFTMLFLLGSILSGIMDGAGGINTTQLTLAIDADDVTLTVADTSGFLKYDYVQIGNEKVQYTNKTDTTFTGCERAYDDTDAVSHVLGSKVYSADSEILNSALGFNVASTGAAVGAIDIPMVGWNFITKTIPRLIVWDYAWLQTSQWLQYIRIILQVLSIGFVIYMSYMIAQTLGGILQGIFIR